MPGTFYRSLSGVVELEDRYAGKSSPEVEIADSCDSQSMAPTAAHLLMESSSIQLSEMLKSTYFRIIHRGSTFSFQAPGLGNFRLTTRAELGIFRSSLRPCASPTTRPEKKKKASDFNSKYV